MGPGSRGYRLAKERKMPNPPHVGQFELLNPGDRNSFCNGLMTFVAGCGRGDTRPGQKGRIFAHVRIISFVNLQISGLLAPPDVGDECALRRPETLRDSARAARRARYGATRVRATFSAEPNPPWPRVPRKLKLCLAFRNPVRRGRSTAARRLRTPESDSARYWQTH
jgi:hypothetical protein